MSIVIPRPRTRCARKVLEMTLKIAPSVMASTLKSILAVDGFRAFPTLKKRKFWGSGLWTDSTYYGSAGTVSAETIKRYIAQQKLT